MSKTPKKRSKPSNSTKLTPELQKSFDDIVRMIKAARKRMRTIAKSTKPRKGRKK